MDKKKTAVGKVIAADLYRTTWVLLDKGCPEGSKWNSCTNPGYLEFNTRCMRLPPGGVTDCVTKFQDVYARWDTENIRKLLIGTIAGTLEAVTTRPIPHTNCYDMAGVKGCNVGDQILVSGAKLRNYMHIILYNYWSGYGSWDCCYADTRQLVDRAIDPLGGKIIREFPQFWGKDFTRDIRCIINGWETCSG
ncbi:hypothetical protein EK21DRAFT_70255 [Setomelanomma holmii]|uniref:Uncharacterized protein n=1 Tax=Setomelanomma holmii TaxID=210430 RepID=A0A9P4H6L2_9PLEO|nr:hypothetical protein EK21DRAFT_70255 [Setomelanomma holmii]